MLIGFSINGGSASPKKTASTKGNFGSGWAKTQKNIAANLHKIRHWDIRCGEYTDIESYHDNSKGATWFIDPPYQDKGKYYRHNKIDFPHLANWCKERAGQVLVCENMGADWLPFQPLKELYGQKNKLTYEAIWIK